MTDLLELACQFNHEPEKRTQVKYSPGLHIIYGESNVGKSDFIRQLTGRYADRNIIITSNVENSAVQVAMQNPDNQIIRHTLDKELAFSLECTYTNSTKIQTELHQLKQALLFDADEKRHPSTLSGGEKELLNIVTTFSLPARVYCIDDALSFLNRRNKKKVVEYIRNKTKEIPSIVLWFTSDIFDVEYGDTHWELTSSNLQQIALPKDKTCSQMTLPSGTLNISIEKLTFGYSSDSPIFNKFSYELNHGRCLGVVGINGCGKSTLSFLLLNALKPESGMINIRCNNQSPKIGYLDQFPERMLGAETLEKFVIDLSEAKLIHENGIENVISVLGEFNIHWNDYKDKPGMDLPWSVLRLSMIVILTNCEYDVVILDEPTFGFGWKQKVNLHRYLGKIFQNKHGIILSHDFDFVHSLCDAELTLDTKSS
ncbi:MAG: ATP-binding cassette domain-containing protein [Candidatus Marinimicrobia bacterium]|nr:ATP-binding cassette domain-containing protein [Candidatus Neomarinimicrobiota bacterium]MBL7059800.1 ATP-binding cassette domain-containing protein [Candidatus Neomarinimicrobiota bacterium]